MSEEFEKEVARLNGIGSLPKEGVNTSKTIPGAQSTISGTPLDIGHQPENRCDTPKTIHSNRNTTSSTSLRKKRGRGAPKGNLNALKTGRYMANIKAARRKNWEFISGIAAFVRQVEVLYGFETRGSRRAKQYWPVLPESARRKYREKARQ